MFKCLKNERGDSEIGIVMFFIIGMILFIGCASGSFDNKKAEQQVVVKQNENNVIKVNEQLNPMAITENKLIQIIKSLNNQTIIFPVNSIGIADDTKEKYVVCFNTYGDSENKLKIAWLNKILNDSEIYDISYCMYVIKTIKKPHVIITVNETNTVNTELININIKK